MKNFIIKSILMLFAVAAFVACEPEELDKPNIGNAPDASEVSFTITQGEDAFHYILENTSTANGIANWNLGNGTKATGDKVIAYYPLPDTFEIELNLYAAGGKTMVAQELVTTETDYSLFTDPMFVNLSGGVDAPEGKTWVMDSLTRGHIGVGPANGIGLAWWTAAPLEKSGAQMYDDEITFNINEFVVTYDNKGQSYVKAFEVEKPEYTNAVEFQGDFIVDYPGPITGSWGITEKAGKNYLTMDASTPIYPNFDVGAVGGEYQILEVSENKLEIFALGGDGNTWHYQLIPKGYTPPAVEYTLMVEETGNPNEYEFGITDVSLPEGFSIESITYDFGDGTTAESTDANETFVRTYMRQGTYPIAVTVVAGGEEWPASQSLVVESNHPDYEPYLLDEMVMYNDFGETMLQPVQADAAGGTASAEVVENPDNSMYPNRSLHSLYFSKENVEWANAYMLLPTGYRFDLEERHTFRLMIYGEAGQEILFKLENTDLGANAWQTGTHDFIYTIQESNTWEVATFDMAGIGAGFDWTGVEYTDDITTDPVFNHGYYNVLRVMLQPGNADGTFSCYLDSFAGPHIEGLK